MFGEELYKVNFMGVTVRVVHDNITTLNVDAIVNPANSLLIMGGGVAAAIKRAGGRIIEEEARRYAPIPVGSAIATTAGRLRAKYVIHAPTMERPAMKIGVDNVRLAMRAALRCADELKVKSVAFPGLGTGVGGVPFSLAAEVMVNELLEYLKLKVSLSEVVLVGFELELAEEFMRALRRHVK